MRRVALLIAVSFAAPVLALAAQGTLPTAGQRVRINTSSSSQWLVGTLAAADQDSLRLWLQGSDSVRAIAVARSAVIRFQVSRGQHSNAGRGAVAGGLIFGSLGLLVGVACQGDQNSFFSPCSVSDVAKLTVLGAAEGAALGALIGAFTHSEGWHDAQLSRPRVTMAPYGAGLRVSIAF